MVFSGAGYEYALQSLADKSKYDPDNKAMAIYLTPSYELLGKVDRKKMQFIWEESGIRKLGPAVTRDALEEAAQ